MRTLTLAFLLLALAGPTAAQAPDPGAEETRERAYVDGLRREDPASADRYVALRDARAAAMTDLRRARERFGVDLHHEVQMVGPIALPDD